MLIAQLAPLAFCCSAFVLPVRRSSSAFGKHGRNLGSPSVAAMPAAPASARLTQIPLQLYNTASRKKERFKPLRPDRVSFYSCGPTVYDHAHIGNFRAFLTYDVLKRWLIYSGYDVEHICNLTDVDDKIIKRMVRDNISRQELTEKYTQTFFTDLAALNIGPASHYPRATEHIEDIVKMIEELIERGYAYESQGSYYFRLSKCERYGVLTDVQSVSETNKGEGTHDADEYAGTKGDARDFALWKAHKPEDGSVFWQTRLGKGRPGWHIECSAMAQHFLGDTIDLHAGGIDLIFPHHENEIAQSEAASGRRFCNCWIHNGFVNVNNEKMSKSKGNFVTLQDILSSDLDLRAFRYLVVTSHYRTPLHFNDEVLQGAKKTMTRLDKLRKNLQREVAAAETGEEVAAVEGVIDQAIAGFEAGMADDLNTPRAAASLFHLVKGAEKAMKAREGVASETARRVLAAMDRIDQVLGVFYEPPSIPGVQKVEQATTEGAHMVNSAEIPEEAKKLLDQRAEAKSKKEWATADDCRMQLQNSFGLMVKDVKGGGVELYGESNVR